MAHNHSNSDKNNANAIARCDKAAKSTTFHDFLGKKGQDSAPAAGGGVRQPVEASPVVSASLGASSGSGRGPISTTSDLGSERHVGSHLEGIPFYGSRGEFTGSETGRYTGTKRSNSDSFMASSRDKLPHMHPDIESSHLMKLLRHAGEESLKRGEETSLGGHQMRPVLAPFRAQSSSGGNAKWDRAIPVNLGPSLQYPPLAGKVVPFGHQNASNWFKDGNAGPSIISQTAADEGSRTGIKGSGILSSINAKGAISERSPSGVLIRTGKQKSGIYISEPESASAPSHKESAGRQMTIFYGGQAHVFDDVHPNKADVIMALAGSNGGSWSTSYAAKSASRPPTSGGNLTPGNERDAGFTALMESHGRLSMKEHGVATGGHMGSVIAKDSKATAQTAEVNTGSKREAQN